MTLITCPECGRQISSHAPACPGCGYPMATQSQAPAAPSALHSPSVWGRVATMVGAWLVAPWIARMLALVAVCVVAYFLFWGRR